MSADIREYLIERFRGDAETLRQRAATLLAVKKLSPGPDAALSSAMALACENVVALAEQLPVNARLDEIVTALQHMVPQLAALANAPESQAAPAVRSVYAGASTRVLELIAAESDSDSSDDDTFDDDELDEDDADDPDFDDDDLYEDDEI